MAASPWEFVPPIAEMFDPNMITNRTSHRMPSHAPVGRKRDETCMIMGDR